VHNSLPGSLHLHLPWCHGFYLRLWRDFTDEGAACKLHFLAGANNAPRKEGANAWYLFCTWEGTARINTETLLLHLDTGFRFDAVGSAIETYTANLVFILSPDDFAARLLNLKTKTRTLTFPSEALGHLQEETTNAAAHSRANPDLVYWNIRQINLHFFLHIQIGSSPWHVHKIFHFLEAPHFGVNDTAWQQGAQARDLLRARKCAPGVTTAALLLL